MKNVFLIKPVKIVVDILLVVSFIFAGVTLDRNIVPDNYWQSTHCLFGVGWLTLIILHVFQNWKMVRAFTRKKVIMKNKVTAFTILTFTGMLLSILFFLFGVHPLLNGFHHIIARLFVLSLIIHTIHKFKRFLALFGRS